jgi:glucose-1-phosphate adenylyltransferase
MANNAVALILGGGRGSRLSPLTSIRSKPAVPLGGQYRLIDIPISNCINSGINRIYVLTQFLSVSLHQHIRRSYSFDSFSGGFVELLAAQETTSDGSDWYQGTADAVRKNLVYYDQPDIEYVVILSGDQLYRMDYRELIETHKKNNADVTISCIPVTREDARGFGIMQVDDDGRVNGFVEKPQTDEELDAVSTDPAWIDAQGIDSKGRDCIASMGMYVFNASLLKELLEKSNYTDFGKELFPEAINSHRVQMHLFDGYWEDIGTIKSFFDANLNMASDSPEFDLATASSPIYTRARFLPPSRMSGAEVDKSLISNGCRLGDGCVVQNSVIGLRTIMESNVSVKQSIVMGNDFYAGEGDEEGDLGVPLTFGSGTVIEGAIIDKNVRIGKNVRIVNSSGRTDTSHDHPLCVIRDGIPIVLKNVSLPDGWDLEKDVP